MKIDKRSRFLGIVQLVFVVAIVALGLLVTQMMKPEQEVGTKQNVAFSDSILSVSVTQPESFNYTPKFSFTGTVAAQTETQIAPQVGGQVTWVSENFTPGASVKKGDLLFRIEGEDYRLAVEQAEANISASSSDLKLLEAEAKLALSEWQDLYPDKEITDLAARVPQIEAARSRLAGAQASKKTAELALKRTRVMAPATARILDTSLDVGQLVTPSMPVGTLYALDNVEISVPVSPDELQLLMPVLGRKVSLSLENSEDIIPGVVSRLGSVLDPRTRQATIYIRPDNVSGLTIGSFINAHISASDVDGALRVPVSALSGRDRLWVVSGGELVSRNVSVLAQESNALIVTPINQGEGILTFPPAEAYDGQKVKIRIEKN